LLFSDFLLKDNEVIYPLESGNFFFIIEKNKVIDVAEKKVSSVKMKPKSKLEDKLAGRSAYYEDTLELYASETVLISCSWC